MNKTKTSELLKQELEVYYNRYATEYQQAHYSNTNRYSPLQFRQTYIEEMIDNANLPSGARVLDVGCGPGELALNLLRKGYNVSAVDISQTMVDTAAQIIMENGFPEWNEVNVGDIENLEFDDRSFDVVVASGVLEYQRDDEKSLSEMKRVLKKDGYLILNVTNKNCPNRIMGFPYDWSKQWGPSAALLGFIKSRLLGRGPINPLPDHRSHSPGKFDQQLSRSGFEKVCHNYFGFGPLPSPFNSLFGIIASPIAVRMEKLTRGPLGFLGGGYIVIARNR
jgi:ubiquinone/menaquinone biosynthesis C-methylase UbiE